MYGRNNLENLDLELLAAIQREQQTEIRREARSAFLLREQDSGGKVGKVMVKRKLTVALAGAALIALWLAQLVLAAVAL